MDRLDFSFTWKSWQPISKTGLVLYMLPSLEPNNNMKNHSGDESITQIPGQSHQNQRASQPSLS